MEDAVIKALEEQVGCYGRLAKLAELQHDHVQHGRTEELLEVLTRRQEILNDIARLEATVAPARRGWSDYLSRLGAADRERAENLMGQTRRLLEEITTADRNDALVLQQRKLNLGKQIQAATAARTVNRNYSVAAYGKRAGNMDVTSG